MNKNVEEYLGKKTNSDDTSTFISEINYSRNVPINYTKTEMTKISWGTFLVTTRLNKHYEKFK